MTRAMMNRCYRHCVAWRLLLAGALLLYAEVVFGCGTERWPVKVATDADAALIGQDISNSAIAPETTIAQLQALAPPKRPQERNSNRWLPTETMIMWLSGTITTIKPEADGDYHIVLSDGAGHTMIVEAPDPKCAATSRFAQQIAEVRQQINAHFSVAEGRMRRLHPNQRVTVQGVPFFDVLHGQEGVAPNGIELHPILDIDFGGPAS